MKKTKLINYITKQKIIRDIVVGIKKGEVEITTDSIEITSLVLEAIHLKIGGALGVIYKEETMFDRCWNCLLYTSPSPRDS